MVQWIKGKLHAKNQGPNSRDEKVIWLLRSFRDRLTDTVAYRCVVCKERDLQGFIGCWEDYMQKSRA